MLPTLIAAVVVAMCLCAASGQLVDSGFISNNYGTYNPDWGNEGRAAPASIAADIPVVYEDHWDVPSRSGNPSLIGPVQFLRRAIINEDQKVVTLPLYAGHNADGTTAWYVLTDTTNRDIADQMGLIFSAKLRYADMLNAVRPAVLDHQAAFVFQSGSIDFSPVRSLVPGASAAENGQAFPPASYMPGSIADSAYTPIVRTPDGVYYNAPVIAFNVSAATLQTMATGNVDYSLVHDKVVSINPANYTVTLRMTLGFSFSKPIFYLSTDASDPLVATLEASTWAAALAGDNQTDRDIDSIPGQGNERLGLIVNGPTNPFPGVSHPYRQGLNSAILDGLDPLNIFGGIPTVNLDYSPLWNIEMIQWTVAAIAAGYVGRTTAFLPDLFSFEAKGLIEAYGGGPIERSGVIINCPTLARLV
jgi:hypothetical protein